MATLTKGEIMDHAESIKQVLDDVMKTNPVNILVVTTDEGGEMNINTNSTGFPGIHYLLNRAEFEIILHEKTALQAKRTEETPTVGKV